MDTKKQLPQCEPAAGRIDPMLQLVCVEQLIEIVWSPAARPCAKWVRQQTRRGAIPCIQRGNRVWYVAKQVIEALSRPSEEPPVNRPRRRGRPPGSKNKPKLFLQGATYEQTAAVT
jgi:hypothetical protein